MSLPKLWCELSCEAAAAGFRVGVAARGALARNRVPETRAYGIVGVRLPCLIKMLEKVARCLHLEIAQIRPLTSR